MVKHFLLKFNHGVELGAYMAYWGHHMRTQDPMIHQIMMDELNHRHQLEFFLKLEGELPNERIDLIFYIIGSGIKYLCEYAPLWSLNYVARIMEMFAIFNYKKLAKVYPQHEFIFDHMANTEYEHAMYFKHGWEFRNETQVR